MRDQLLSAVTLLHTDNMVCLPVVCGNTCDSILSEECLRSIKCLFCLFLVVFVCLLLFFVVGFFFGCCCFCFFCGLMFDYNL